MASKWYRPVKSGTAPVQCQLFCFPYGGGNTTFYQTWAKQLPPGIQIVVCQLPGRTTRFKESAFTAYDPLLKELVAELLKVIKGPYAFFGHSMGALLSFEMARSLRRQSAPLPRCFFPSGHKAPQLSRTREKIAHLPEAQFIEKLIEYNGISETILENKDLMELLLPTIRADFTMLESHQYREEAPLDLPIYASGGTRDSKVSLEDLKAWGIQTTGEFEYQMYEGDHFFIHPMEKDVVSQVGQTLKKVMSTTV